MRGVSNLWHYPKVLKPRVQLVSEQPWLPLLNLEFLSNVLGEPRESCERRHPTGC